MSTSFVTRLGVNAMLLSLVQAGQVRRQVAGGDLGRRPEQRVSVGGIGVRFCGQIVAHPGPRTPGQQDAEQYWPDGFGSTFAPASR
jgi:hypothetical protein